MAAGEGALPFKITIYKHQITKNMICWPAMTENMEPKERWRSAQDKEDSFWRRNDVIDEQMDRVICVNALDHMIHPDRVLEEIRRVMKEGGIFVLGNFLHPPKIAGLRTFIERWLPFFREAAHPYSYTLKSIRQFIGPFFRIQEEIRVFQKESALFPSMHREDWIFICRRKEDV